MTRETECTQFTITDLQKPTDCHDILVHVCVVAIAHNGMLRLVTCMLEDICIRRINALV
jgi:hypothetical protein